MSQEGVEWNKKNMFDDSTYKKGPKHSERWSVQSIHTFHRWF